MALIICTECGKEFSDKASACPHCGCPYGNFTIHFSWKGDGGFRKAKIFIDEKEVAAIKPSKSIGISVSAGNHAVKIDAGKKEVIEETISVSSDIEYDFEEKMGFAHPNLSRIENVPKCPTCGSTKIIKLGFIDRAFGNTFRCKNCKYEW